VKTRVNWPDFFAKLGFQDRSLAKIQFFFIPSKVLGDFKANKVKLTSPMTEKVRRRVQHGFQDKIFIKETIIFIVSKVLLKFFFLISWTCTQM